MDWLSLLPAGLSLLGGIFGGSNKTTTSTQTSPKLTALANTVLDAAKTNYSKPYTAYTGERVAGPTAARTALTPVLQQVGSQTMAGMNDSNGYRARISEMLNSGPGHITAPTLLTGGASTYQKDPLPYTPVPINPALPPVAALPPPTPTPLPVTPTPTPTPSPTPAPTPTPTPTPPGGTWGGRPPGKTHSGQVVSGGGMAGAPWAGGGVGSFISQALAHLQANGAPANG